MAIERDIDVRWDLALYGRPIHYTDTQAVGLTLTKQFQRINRSLEDIAAMLVEDGVWEDEMVEGDDSLESLTGKTWEAIETLLKAWAARAPARREAYRAAMIETAPPA